MHGTCHVAAHPDRGGLYIFCAVCNKLRHTSFGLGSGPVVRGFSRAWPVVRGPSPFAPISRVRITCPYAFQIWPKNIYK